MVRQIDVHELKSRLQASAPTLLLDVRQPWENAYAALPDSLLIPLDQLHERAAEELSPPAGTLVVAYCHHGVRSLSAAAILEQMGVTEVASLRGGIDAWSRLVDPSVPVY